MILSVQSSGSYVCPRCHRAESSLAFTCGEHGFQDAAECSKPHLGRCCDSKCNTLASSINIQFLLEQLYGSHASIDTNVRQSIEDRLMLSLRGSLSIPSDSQESICRIGSSQSWQQETRTLLRLSHAPKTPAPVL